MNNMRDRIRRLSWKIEFIVVLGVAFGWTLPSSLLSLLNPAAIARSATPPISDIALWGTILFELILLCLLIPILRVRGWTLARLGIQPSLRGCLQGGVLALAAYGLYIGGAVLVGSVWPEVAHALAETRLVGEGLSWTTIVAVSTVNPFYEEVFVCGYVISVLTERRNEAIVAPARAVEGEGESTALKAASPEPAQGASLATAVNISAAIRLSYHFYQGVAGVLAVVPLGLLFGFWFARTRQLWPLIVAHAILDFAGLAAGTG
jgi:CAAX protease family protein